jgi:hypothetical protein
VSTKGRGIFETTTVAEPVVTGTSFSGSGAGDGYNVGFGNGYVLNVWHHNTALNVECHLMSGENCPTYIKNVTGYQTAMASTVHVDKATNKVYTAVRQTSSGDVGFYCLDYSDLASIVNCTTPFVSLADVAAGGTNYEYRGSNTSQEGTKIWTIDTTVGSLLCFDIATSDACTGGHNGFVIGSAGGAYDGKMKARVHVTNNKVFFTVNNTMGCYDIATISLCGNPDSTPIAIPAAPIVDSAINANRHVPVPVQNTDGSFRGACDIDSQLCIDGDGATTTMPTGLAAHWTANPANNYIAGQNSQSFAITESKMYYGGIETGDRWSKDLICWDYSTDALCAGFDGAGRGITKFYTADIDPDNPGCVWVNQDSGQIIPLNAETGEVGCASGDAIVELPYAGVVPRMGCDSDGRVISWEDIQLNLNGVSSSDVAISILDDNGAEVADWQDVAVDSTGYLDMSGLTVAESSTTPSIQIVGLNGVTLEELELITGIVTFEAEEPEFCFALQAITNCPDESVNNPTVADVPAGIVEGSSITYPTSGAREVGSKQRTVIPGTNAGSLCASSAWSAFIPTLAETGFDTVPVALGGLVAVAAGIGAAVYTKRRRNNS